MNNNILNVDQLRYKFKKGFTSTDEVLEATSKDLKKINEDNGVIVGTYGSASQVPQVTVNSKGKITSISNVTIALSPGTVSLTQDHILVGSAANVATDVAMSGEASIVASGAITLSNAAVISKVLTGYVSGAGTVAATDTILQAIQKLNGNITSLSTSLTLSVVLTNGNNATGQNIINLQQIYSTVGAKTTRLYLDASAANQMYMHGVNGNVNWFISGSYSGTTPTVSLNVYDLIHASPYATGIAISRDSILVSGSLTGTFPGAQYGADYSANYTTRSLIDKGYAAATFAPISTTVTATDYRNSFLLGGM